jgi:hypothetical protein
MAEEATIKAVIEAPQVMRAIVAATIATADTQRVALETIHRMIEAVTADVIRVATHGHSAMRIRAVEATEVVLMADVIKDRIAVITPAVHASPQDVKTTERIAAAVAVKSGADRTVTDKIAAARSEAMADTINAAAMAASVMVVRKAMGVAVIMARTGNKLSIEKWPEYLWPFILPTGVSIFN